MTQTSCVTYGCGDKRPASLPSPRRGARGLSAPRAERAGVRWGNPERLPKPTSPSRFAGPSLSPLKGEEGFCNPDDRDAR
jgi:hypothetical protein